MKSTLALLFLVACACRPTAPADPAPGSTAVANAAIEAPVPTGEAPHQLTAPASYEAMERSVEEVGCRLVDAAGQTVGCLEVTLEMGFASYTLTLRDLDGAPSAPPIVIYDGPSELETKRFDEGLTEANRTLQRGGYTRAGTGLQTDQTATIEGSKLVVTAGGDTSEVDLPPLGREAPTAGLEAHVATCCRWVVEDAAFFAGPRRAMVRLRRACDFGAPAAKRDGVPDACSDAEYNEENDPVSYVYRPVAL